MYYIIVPKEVIDERGVFTDKPRLSDGGAVVPVGDLRFTRFSYGGVRLLNDKDTLALMEQDRKENNGKK